MDMPVPTEAPPALGLPAVLQAAAAELMHLAGIADGLGVGQAVDAERWQSLDRMSQHLGELSVFLSAVSCAIPDFRPDLADALAAVRVGRLVSRLTDSLSSEADEDPGELELFDG